jgi:hypothetical protein
LLPFVDLMKTEHFLSHSAVENDRSQSPGHSKR